MMRVRIRRALEAHVDHELDAQLAQDVVIFRHRGGADIKLVRYLGKIHEAILPCDHGII
jgi:hypothetical protein